MSESAAFTIEELTGDKRRIWLRQRALPHRPFELSTKQRVEIDWYGGNPEGTATITGAKEDPTVIAGWWKSKFLGFPQDPPMTVDGAPVLTAREAADLLDDVVRVGQQLQVQWLNNIRRGFLTGFRKRWHNSNDLEWEMEFAWISRGEAPGPSAFITRVQASDTFGALTSAFDRLGNVPLPPFPINGNALNGLQGLQQSIEDAIAGVQDTVQNLTDKILTPVRAVRGIIATLRGLEQSINDLGAFLDGQLASELNGSRETQGRVATANFADASPDQLAEFAVDPLDSQSFAERLSADLFREELEAWARELQTAALEQRDALSDQIQSDLLGVVTAREGQDLRELSQRFYSTPFEWRRIALFNELGSSELEAGQIVLIPRINPEEASQRAPGL